MKDRVFVDTNILVYAHDRDAARRYELANEMIGKLWEERRGIISTQVLQEFYVTLTRKVKRPLRKSAARRIVQRYFSWELVINDPRTIFQASEIEEAHRISFWDALIVSAAYFANASVILTEDLNHGQYLEGIFIKNPFVE